MFALGNGDVSSESQLVVARSRHSGGRRSLDKKDNLSLSTIGFKKVCFDVPLGISKRFRDVKFKTLVGLSGLVPCAWYAVDDTLTLWRFGAEETTIQCDGVITAVAIGVPSPFVFEPSAKYIVVVATEESVSVHAIDGDLKQVRIAPLFLPVPNRGLSTFTQASVTATGRVFLWSPSEPSVLTELRYLAKASWFRSRLSYSQHSLVRTSGAAGIVSSVFSKLFGSILSPVTAKPHADSLVKLFIHPESSFKYFVSVDSLNVSLHEISSCPSAGAMTTGAWRHSADTDIEVRVVARTAMSDVSPCVGCRIVNALVTVDIATEAPIVDLFTDNGELITLSVAVGQLRVQSTRSISQVAPETMAKKFRTSVNTAVSGNTGSITAATTSGSLAIGGSGTKIFTSQGTEYETNGSVLAVCTERPVETDGYSAFVLPQMRSEDNISPASQQSVIVLTGKGVTVLSPQTSVTTAGGSVPIPVSPKTVTEIVAILSSGNTMFAYKPMFVRAISDDISPATLGEEQDFAHREKLVRPLAGGIWLGGVKKLAQALLAVLEHQPILISGREGKILVGPSRLVLESVAGQAKNLVKFVRQVVAATGIADTQDRPLFGYQRRDHMHSVLKETVAKHQAVFTLNKAMHALSEVSETIGFFAVLAEYPAAFLGGDITGEAVACHWTVKDFPRPVLKYLCETLIACDNGQHVSGIVEKLRTACPSILCAVSPSVVPFNAEGVAAMIHCAISQKSPVQVLLEAVRTLGRNNPAVSKTLNEVIQIIRSLPSDSEEAKKFVLSATMDGLQERFIDETVVVSVLAWAGACLSASLNDHVIEYLFEHGNTDHIAAAASSNSNIERYLERVVKKTARPTTVTQVLAQVLQRTGRGQQGGELLEKTAFGSAKLSLSERIHLLSEAQHMYPLTRRAELLAIAQYVQEPLMERIGSPENALLGIADLHQIASDNDAHDIVLTCYLFVSVKEADLVRAWTNVLFANVSFFTATGNKHIQTGVLEFLADLHAISVKVNSTSVWKKPEIVTALVEYLFCMQLHGPRTINVAEEFLGKILKLSPQQVVETYVKMIRELNVWSSAIPRVRGATDLVPPSPETLRDHLVDVVLSYSDAHRAEMMSQKLLSLLILVRNYLQSAKNERLEKIIESLSQNPSSSSNQHASLPGW